MKKTFKNYLIIMLVFMLGLCSCLGIFTGCSSSEKNEINKLKTQCAELEKANNELNDKVANLEKSNNLLEDNNEFLKMSNEKLNETILSYNEDLSILQSRVNTLSTLNDYLSSENDYFRSSLGESYGEGNLVGCFYDCAVGFVSEYGEYVFKDTFTSDYYLYFDGMLGTDCPNTMDARSFTYLNYVFSPWTDTNYDCIFLIEYNIYSFLDESGETFYVIALNNVLSYEDFEVEVSYTFVRESAEDITRPSTYASVGYLTNVTYSVDEISNVAEVKLGFVFVGRVYGEVGV